MKKNKYTYEIIKRSEDVALLKGVNIYGSITWEVWRIRKTKKERTFPNGTVIPAGTEYAPSNEDWGRYGWTGATEGDARLKYRALLRGDDRAIIDLRKAQREGEAV